MTTMMMMKVRVALVLALSALAAGSCSETTEGPDPFASRTVEQCESETCDCVYATDCPGEMTCYNGACTSSPPDTTDEPDAVPDGTSDPGETPPDEGGDEQTPDGDGGPGPDQGDGGEVPPGAFGTFCKGNIECISGWCVDSPEGGYCTKPCDEGCPDGWACKPITNLIDTVELCVQEKNRLCEPCVLDSNCGDGGADSCIEIGGGQFCAKNCELDECPGGYTCQDVTSVEGTSSKQCVPDNNSCDCTTEKAGDTKGCSLSNAEGTCTGTAVCDPLVGWTSCDAPEPTAEACNGLDDDCDGNTDEGQSPESCDIDNEFGTCPGIRTCQGPAGWVCSAQEPIAEICDGLDNECDGEIDEDFLVAGPEGELLIATAEHCGNCGLSCADKFAGAAEVACDVSTGVPTCVIIECEPGYFLFNEVTCLSEDAGLCSQCQEDDDCFGPLAKCLQVSDTDPRKFCARDCSGASGFSTTCPASYECADLSADFGEDVQQCVPVTGSCDCTEANEGQVKACSQVNALGTCFGQETCDPEAGWVGCTAPEPAEESCNGVDDDCDGLVDEDQVVGEPCSNDNDFGSCAGVTVCKGAGIVCNAKTPAEETCNGVDDDCDGQADEDFATSAGGALKYGLSTAHCGACNYSCPPVPNGTVACDPSPEVPQCVVGDCDEGYYDYLGITCLPVPTTNSCAPCTTDADCLGPADSCVDEGASGSFCARDCEAGGIYDSADTPCSGATGEQSCCPDGYTCTDLGGGSKGCRPNSNACSCSVDGYVEGCSESNAFGTCVGSRTCSLSGANPGWSACSAPVPAAEVCDGADNDCDGAVDQLDSSLDTSTTPNGLATCETGPACQGEWVCQAGGWACTAKASTDEVCDGQDNDCDGEADEDFLTGGQYLSAAHCGGCGLNCAIVIAGALTTECQLIGGQPKCVATECEPGTFPFGDGSVCLALPSNLCESCSSDADCLVPSSQCVTVGPESFCGRSCALDSPFGEDCPSGYSCTDVGGGDPQCVPDSSTCVCNPDTEGLQRSCPVGACVGLQSCELTGDGAYEFTDCSAEGVIPEVCDGTDNDCDGSVDEGFVGPTGAYDQDEHCGVCGNNCLLTWNAVVQHAIGACDAGSDPPACVIAACTTEDEGGTTYEYLDSNGLPGDGCECKRVAGNTDNDPPDLDFGGYPTASTVYGDDNCDGVDGVVDDALFVSAANTSAGDGSLANPYQTIGQALSAFAGSGASYILVAGGVYQENVVLSAGVQLHGGYAPDFKSRNILTFQTEIRGQEPSFGGSTTHGAVNAEGISGGATTIVSGFTISGYDISTTPTFGGAGYASYGLYALNSDDSLVVRNNRIVGGVGGPGAAGSNGSNGFGANSSGGGALDGGNGQDATGCTSGVCNGQSQSGGAAGTNPQCSAANGIAGGGVTCPIYNQPAYTQPDPTKDGTPGYSWTRDNLTNNGCDDHMTEAGFPDAIQKLDGGNGKTGADGNPGQQGNGCSNAFGGYAGGEWVAAGASGGASGSHGARGGTGGASGGIDTAEPSEMPAGIGAKGNDRYKLGATGGGAGAGGCGGTGGGAAGSGGASIAVFVAYTSATSAPPLIADNRVVRGSGGNGGVGGYGGSGGDGGDGGVGGDSQNFWIDFRAGDGGRGGRGGEGGGGGGGCGGPSFGVAAFGYPAGWTLDYASANTFETPDAVSTGGPGGDAGPSGATNANGSGSTGASQNVYVVPN